MKNRGLTLVELMIVIAIIGIISALCIPALINAREKAAKNLQEKIDKESGPVSMTCLTMSDLEKLPYLISVAEASDDMRSITFTTRVTSTTTGRTILRFDEPSYKYIKGHMQYVDVKTIFGLWKTEQDHKEKASGVKAEK